MKNQLKCHFLISALILYFCKNKLFVKQVVIITIAFLLGCSGKDGDSGPVYISMTWSSDVTAFDLSSMLAGGTNPAVFYENTKYELERNKTGKFYWKSSGTTYYLNHKADSGQSGSSGTTKLLIFPEDGTNGRGTTNKYYVSGNTVTDKGTVYGLTNERNYKNVAIGKVIKSSRAIQGYHKVITDEQLKETGKKKNKN